MFDRDSRYARCPIKEHVDASGRRIAYVARRLIRDSDVPVAEMRVRAGDRLDLMAYRAYGDPGQSWRIKDANPDREPSELPYVPGRRLKITQIRPE